MESADSSAENADAPAPPTKRPRVPNPKYPTTQLTQTLKKKVTDWQG